MASVNLVALLCFILTCGHATGEEFPRVKIENGELKGIFLKSREGKQYSAFFGIPYAKPPQRFKLAKPAEPWSGIREAVEFGEKCMQKVAFTETVSVVGSEDCLFINIYSPNLDGDLPVMVFIHGGAFFAGSSNEYRETYFMDEKVVLVTFNYRLGPLGFLNTGDGEVEANLGLKDQVLALQFVQKNVKAFGGDPSRVTIFGESAGGASVHHHVLSPLSKGLFSKAIAQSGTALLWGVKHEPENPAFKLGRLLGCFLENTEETSEILVECLKRESPLNILKQSLAEWHTEPISVFSPSIEKPGKSEQIFLAEAPMDILKSGNFNKVPIIFSSCADEGLFINAQSIGESEQLTKDINDDYLRVLPIALYYKYEGYYPYEQNWMSYQIKNFYFGTNKIDKSRQKNLTDMFSDREIFHPIEKSITLHSKHSKVFNGLFTFQGKWSVTSLMGFKKVLGVAHGDELQYLFDGLFPSHDANSREESVSKTFVKVWTSFASTDESLSCDGVTWDSINPEKLKQDGISYFALDLPPKVLQNPFKDRMSFWEELINGARPGNLPKLINI